MKNKKLKKMEKNAYEKEYKNFMKKIAPLIEKLIYLKKISKSVKK